MNGISMLILSVGGIIAVLFFVTYAAQKHDLNGIKDKTVGNRMENPNCTTHISKFSSFIVPPQGKNV